MSQVVPRSIFYVGKRPHAAWGWDLHIKNADFIDDIDPDYFEFVASTMRAQFGGANEQRASIAIRSIYHHALETFFLLIVGAIQAPHCMPGWVNIVSTHELRDLIARILDGSMPIKSVFQQETLNWSEVAEAIFQFWSGDADSKAIQIAQFSTAWEKLSRAWLMDFHQFEHNAIKHGFRVKPGGFPLRLQVARPEGELVQPGDVLDLGGSDYGSHFFVADRLGGSNNEGYKPNFKLTSHHLNWSVEAMMGQISLVSLSIANIRHCIRTYLGQGDGEYRTNDDPAAFTAPFELKCGPSAMTFDPSLEAEDIVCLSKDDIAQAYENWQKSAEYSDG